MRKAVSKDFFCSPPKVLEYKIEEVLYHLSNIIDNKIYVEYLTDKQKNKSL